MTVIATEIGVGYGVWEKTPESSDYGPRGGVVVEVSKRTDAETAEVRLAWTAIDYRRGGLCWVTLDESQVAAEHVHLPNNAYIRPLLRRICGTLASGSTKSWTDWDRRAVRAVYVLSEVVE